MDTLCVTRESFAESGHIFDILLQHVNVQLIHGIAICSRNYKDQAFLLECHILHGNHTQVKEDSHLGWNDGVDT